MRPIVLLYWLTSLLWRMGFSPFWFANALTHREAPSKLIEDADGYGYTMRLIRGYCEEAIRALNVFRDSEAKQCLKQIVESVCKGAERLMDNYML